MRNHDLVSDGFLAGEAAHGNREFFLKQTARDRRKKVRIPDDQSACAHDQADDAARDKAYTWVTHAKRSVD